MSFIDDSEKNVEFIKEVSGGAVGGFVGRSGMGIDRLFAGPYHPDSGHGSKNKQLLLKQLKDRREKRKDLTSDRDDVIDDYSGLPDPVGGYYNVDTEFVELAYDELEVRNQIAIEYSDENTPPADIEWKSTGWDYDYDEPGEAYKIKDIVYDDEPTYAGDNYINNSETNWKIINRG